MTDRYRALRAAIAAGPTPGVRRISDDGISVIDDTGGVILSSRRPDGCSSRLAEREAQQRANAMLAAVADPGTIAALLAEREALRKLVAAGCLLSSESEEYEFDDDLVRGVVKMKDEIERLTRERDEARAERDALRLAAAYVLRPKARA